MTAGKKKSSEGPTVADSLREYGRGMAGGLLFSLPLLYTMEMWWSGFISEPRRLLLLMAVTMVLLLAYNRFSGMRHDSTWVEVVIDSIEAAGLGLVVSALTLYLIGRIGPGVSGNEIVGKIVVESAMVAIGFSVGAAQLGAGGRGGEARDGGSGDQGKDDGKPSETRAFIQQLVVALCGAILFAANVGPTQEITVIGMETSPLRLLGIVLFSMAMAAFILFFIDFTGAEKAVNVEGNLDIVLGIVITYAVALVTSAAILWFFGRFSGVSPEIAVRHTVVLAFPASLGASAGRLLLQI
ncbi:MAG: TIGR02587 family membrane protein [Acidobacteriota bacterium]